LLKRAQCKNQKRGREMFLEPPRFLLTKVFFNLLDWGYSKGQMLSCELVESIGYRAHEFTFVATKLYKMMISKKLRHLRLSTTPKTPAEFKLEDIKISQGSQMLAVLLVVHK
jgi:hypothetical protein